MVHKAPQINGKYVSRSFFRKSYLFSQNYHIPTAIQNQFNDVSNLIYLTVATLF